MQICSDQPKLHKATDSNPLRDLTEGNVQFTFRKFRCRCVATATNNLNIFTAFYRIHFSLRKKVGSTHLVSEFIYVYVIHWLVSLIVCICSVTVVNSFISYIQVYICISIFCALSPLCRISTPATILETVESTHMKNIKMV